MREVQYSCHDATFTWLLGIFRIEYLHNMKGGYMLIDSRITNHSLMKACDMFFLHKLELIHAFFPLTRRQLWQVTAGHA
jgi:hypothetical protein